MRRYGKQVLINLIDQRGNEREVGEAYETQVRLLNHPQLRLALLSSNQLR